MAPLGSAAGIPMLKTIAVEDLCVGMYLSALEGSWLKNPFWKTARMLDKPDDVERIRHSGIAYAVIDIAKGCDVPAESEPAAADDAASAPTGIPQAVPGRVRAPPTSLQRERKRAAQICMESRRAVVKMFGEARMGAALSTESANEVVDDIVESVFRNGSALISLARLKTQDDYTYMHSVSVCALMVALAKQMGLDEKAMHEAGFAGLTHDIGKMAIPGVILNKPGKLTDAEFVTVKTHPEAGHQMLSQAGILSDIALDFCLHHHEKMDGTGYPHRLAGDQISMYARMGAVCDVYDAITSNRPYKSGWGPAHSIKQMASWVDSHFDPTIFKAFVKAVGIYPVGTLVRLASNRLAVVVDQSEKSLLCPQVRAFFSCTSGTNIVPVLIDLAAPGERDKIASFEDAAAWGLENIDRFWL